MLVVVSTVSVSATPSLMFSNLTQQQKIRRKSLNTTILPHPLSSLLCFYLTTVSDVNMVTSVKYLVWIINVKALQAPKHQNDIPLQAMK